MFGFASCTSDHDNLDSPPSNGGEWGGGTVGDKTMLVLNIRSLDSRATSQVPLEKVKTLRIIIINTGENETTDNSEDESHAPAIECNRLIELSSIPASQVSYTWIWPTYKGKKNIYVIANEASIANGITDELEKYVEGEDTKPTQLEDFLDKYAFAPQYSVQESSIYLPYTYYNTDLEARKHEVTNITAYLVPVATKFVFNFTNKRDKSVRVNGIFLNSTNSSNYLFAKVGEKDYKKELPDDADETSYYWIDWLAKVSEESHKNQGFVSNEKFNEKYGWIKDYEIPNEKDSGTCIFVGENGQKEAFNVPGMLYNETQENTSVPGTYTVGPFYVPESKNLKDASENNKDLADQIYYLTMFLETEGAQPPDFKDVAIPNLKALFRNTYVIINVNMLQGNVEVYAEIENWNRKKENGRVEEGDAPN